MLKELLKKIKSNKNIVYYVIIAVIAYLIYTEYKKKETFISHSIFQNSLRNSSTIEILPSDTSEERIDKIKMFPSIPAKIQLQNGLKDLVLTNNLAIIIPGGEIRMQIVITEQGRYNFSFDVFAPGTQSDSFFMQLRGDDVDYDSKQQTWFIPRRDASLQKQIRRESWTNYTLKPGKYSLFIRGREPTGISSMTITKLTPPPARAPSPAFTRAPKTTRVTTTRAPTTTRVTTTRAPTTTIYEQNRQNTSNLEIALKGTTGTEDIRITIDNQVLSNIRLPNRYITLYYTIPSSQKELIIDFINDNGPRDVRVGYIRYNNVNILPNVQKNGAGLSQLSRIRNGQFKWGGGYKFILNAPTMTQFETTTTTFAPTTTTLAPTTTTFAPTTTTFETTTTTFAPTTTTFAPTTSYITNAMVPFDSTEVVSRIPYQQPVPMNMIFANAGAGG